MIANNSCLFIVVAPTADLRPKRNEEEANAPSMGVNRIVALVEELLAILMGTN